jgi:NTP pyrophosphatase (non-canonical NTP hydrolase)
MAMNSSIARLVTSVELGASECDLLVKLADRVKAAEEKHPDFSDGIYQGVGVIGEEYGELCQALNKNQGEARVMDEALDLLCVVWRFCRGDWEKSRQE